MPARDANQAEIDAIVDLSRLMHEESNFASLSLNEAKLRSSLTRAVSKPDVFCLKVYETRSQIIGYILGMIQEPFFSTDTIAADLMFYVSPMHRGGPAAYGLWAGFRDWARARGAKELRQGITTGIRPERTDRFFRKLGMEPTGFNYRLELSAARTSN